MTADNTPTVGPARPSNPALEEAHLALRRRLRGDPSRAITEMPDPTIIKRHHHDLEAVLSAANSDGVDANFLWQLSQSRRRTHGPDGAAAAGQPGAPVASQPDAGKEIELTANFAGYETTVILEEGEDRRENIAASYSEDLHSLTLTECRVEIDGRRVSAYESDDGRFHLSS